MATKKISELEAITEADGSDVLAIVDVSEGKTNKITKNNLLIGAGHSIEMSLNQETYALTLILKNAAGTELNTASIDLPNENAITNISYSNGTLTLTKQSGVTSTVDISGLINGLATETALTNLANALKETIGIDTNTYNESQTYNTGDIVIQNEKIYKANQDNITGTFDSSKWDEISLYEYQKLQDEAIKENYEVITKLQEDVEDLTERMEDAENNEMTNTPEIATSHYLQDSADSRVRKFIPIGRTTQESTTGKNKLNCANPLAVTGNVNIPCDLPAGTYTISCSKAETTGTTNYMVQVQYEDSTNADFSIYREALTGTLTLTKRATNIRLYSQDGYDHSQGVTTTFYNLMVRDSSITDDTYEPYTGGEPAPNPIYPYAIKNTGDNGSVNEKIENKNLWNGDNIYLNQTYTQNSSIKLGYFEGEEGTYTISLTEKLSNGCYVYVGANGSIIPTMNKKATFTLAESGRHVVWIVIRAGTYTNFVSKIQIEPGSTASNYQAHSEQTLSFPLAQGQKLMQGGYPDDDEKVHHKRIERVFDGSDDENWSLQSINSNGIANFAIGLADYSGRDENLSLCDYFSSQSTPIVQTTNEGYYLTISKTLYIRIKSTTASTVAELRTWLSNHNMKFQYELAEEQTEDFTEEQKTAWEQIKKARTYKNITHISSEDETPANVEVEYVVDINTIDDRITALEAKVDLLEE